MKTTYVVKVSGKSNQYVLDKIYEDSKNINYNYLEIQKIARDKLKKMGLYI